MASITHWLDDPNYRELGHEHINKIRISAESMLKLIQLRNSLTGEKKSVYEASVESDQEA